MEYYNSVGCEFEGSRLHSSHTEILVQCIRESIDGDTSGNMRLYIAILENSMEMLEYFLQQDNIDLNYRTCEGNTALLLSLIMQRSDSLIIHLIEAGCDPSVSNSHGISPLHLAVAYSTNHITHALLKHGSDVDSQDESGNTPLHTAVLNNNLEAVCILLYYEIDVSILNKRDQTALDIALRYNRVELVLDLIDYYDDTVLLLAEKQNCPIAVELAMERVQQGANVNCLDLNDNNVLVPALYNHNAKLFKLIWTKIDHRLLLHCQSPFLRQYIVQCGFSVAEWLECLYLILNLSLAVDLLEDDEDQDCGSNGFYIYYILIHILAERHVQAADRLAVIYTFLSFGFEMGIECVDLVYNLYGYNEELEAIIYCASLSECCDYRFLLLRFIFATEEEPSLESVFDYFCNEIHNLQTNVASSLDFFSLSVCMRQQLLDDEQICHQLEVMPKIQSLVELSRNASRAFIKQNNEIKRPYDFYDAVKRLNLPPLIRDVICFKKPLR